MKCFIIKIALYLYTFLPTEYFIHSFIALLSKDALKIVTMELPEVITPKQFKYYAETLLCIKFDLNIILKIKRLLITLSALVLVQNLI